MASREISSVSRRRGGNASTTIMIMIASSGPLQPQQKIQADAQQYGDGRSKTMHRFEQLTRVGGDEKQRDDAHLVQQEYHQGAQQQPGQGGAPGLPGRQQCRVQDQ